MQHLFLFPFFCVCIFHSLLFSNSPDYFEPSEVVATEGLPSNIVNQSVCVISGEYTHSVQDLVLPGPESLVLQRFYSNFAQGNVIKGGWSFNHYEWIAMQGRYSVEKGPINVLGIRQASGAVLDYTHPQSETFMDKHKVEFDFVTPKGLTNGASNLSGRTTSKIKKSMLIPKKTKIVAISGAGTKRTFAFNEFERIFAQKSEEKANGSLYLYRKTKTSDQEIAVKNKKTHATFSRLNFKNRESGKARSLSIESSDGRKIRYFFKPHPYTIKTKNGERTDVTDYLQDCLTKVENPSAPTEEYEYKEKARTKQVQVVAKKRPEGRYLLTEYYREGHNSVGGGIGNVYIREEDDYRLDRVKKQKAPVGHDEKRITTHRYVYDCKVTGHNEGPKKLGSGTTDVYDAYGHQTQYAYDGMHRLASITRYAGTEKYHEYSKEKFLWDKEGNLKAKIFRDANRTIHHARHFKYDTKGNVLQSTLCGKLTGAAAPEIVFDHKNSLVENGYERETKTYEYSDDGLNLCLKETDSLGKTTLYEYHHGTDILKRKYIVANGRICLREFYYYDDNNVLIQKITDDGTRHSPEDLAHATQRYIVDNVPRDKAPLGLPQSTEESGLDFASGQKILLRRSEFDYSPEGHLLKQKVYDANRHHAYTLYWEYDAHGNLTSETNALGETIFRKYDANDNLIYQQDPDECSIKNTYDFANRLIEQVKIHPDGQHFSTGHTYDYLNHCIASTDLYGQKTQRTYDDFGRVIEVVCPAVPNEEGHLVEGVIKTEYDIAGYPTLIQDAKGGKTKTQYNIRGQPIEMIHPDGTSESWTYNVTGQVLQHCSKTGVKTIYLRDPFGRATEESLFAPDGEMLKKTTQRYNALHLLETTDPEGVKTFYHYDFAGRLVETRKEKQRVQNIYDPLGRLCETREWFEENDYRATCKEYDLLNRVIEERVQSSDGKVLQLSKYSYDTRGNKIFTQVGEVKNWTEYDSHSRPIKITDNLGHETHIHYDIHYINAFGQRVLQKTETDPLGYQTLHIYDTAGRIAHTQRKNPFGQVIASQSQYYDLCGKLCKTIDEVFEEGKSVREITTLCHYNAGNQITALIEASGTPEQKITRTHYNEQGQKTAILSPDGTTLHYAYDPLGRLKTLQSSDGSISYLYDYNGQDQVIKVTDLQLGQTTERTYDSLGQLIKEKLGNGLWMEYLYDLTGRMKKIVYPDASSTEYFYNAADLKEVRRIKDGAEKYIHADEIHNLTGQVERSRPPGQNSSVEYTYDPLGRTVKIASPHFSQIIPSEGFDAAGNLLKFDTQGLSYQFTYDDHYHIQSEEGHVGHTYQFDSLSNRTLKDESAHEHNSFNSLLKNSEEQFTYDLNGNLTERRCGNQINRYSYDALDRLIAVEQNGVSTHYSYDPFNRRLSKKRSDGEEELFLYQAQEEIGRYFQGTLQELRLLGENPRSCMIALELKGTPYVPQYDICGNVIALMNLEGQLVERYRYTVFGEEEILSPDGKKRNTSFIANPWRYAGKRVDEETGLSAFGLRYYDPEIGRWITPDPAGYADGPNLYAYVHNSPLLYWDQFGLYSNSESINPPVHHTITYDFSIHSGNDSTHKFSNFASSIYQAVAPKSIPS